MPITSSWLDNTCVIFQLPDAGLKGRYSKRELRVRGSGILLSHKDKFILVTAKHVVKDRKNLCYVYHYQNKDHALIIEQTQKKLGVSWHFHDNEDIDIAVTYIQQARNSMPVFQTTDIIIPFKELNRGSNVYIIGFPLGLVPDDNSTSLIKKGIISRTITQKTTLNFVNGDQKVIPEKSILLDAYIDEGNSGGPIIQERDFWQLKPSSDSNVVAEYNKEGLIGFAKGHFTIGNTNAGLGEVISSDYLIEILNSEEMEEEYRKFIDLN